MRKKEKLEIVSDVSKKYVHKFATFLSIIVCIITDIVFLFVPNKLFVCGYFERRWGKILHNNWGDDINVFFLHEITGKKIFLKNNSYVYRWLPIHNYGCIGSIIGRNTDKHSEIWGSGLISETVNSQRISSKINSVRGPLTRAALIKHGIECPERYGDPALLVSKYYKPDIDKRYELGIVTHIEDEDNDVVKEYCSKYPDVLVVKMRGYHHWHDIPDQILSCKRIISSSLHGLIIADSYGIPNVWVRFSDNIL